MIRLSCLLAFFVLSTIKGLCAEDADEGTLVVGRIVDAETGQVLPARLYIVGPDGKSHFARSAGPKGSAVRYDKQRGTSFERHTTLSAHPFNATLEPGRYRFTAVRGKEFLETSQDVFVADKQVDVTLKLKRWIDMAARGWYSGDTHVHRTLADLPNVVLAEDLNVAFPLTQWETHAYNAPRIPKADPKSTIPDEPKWHFVDKAHAIHPRNTEYEIFTVDRKSHHLGAFFVIRHKKPFKTGVPPVSEIAREARRQGALLELDKHNWPWSMAIVPIMNIDLYELTNNHIWRTDYYFKGWGEQPGKYMGVTSDTENGWTRFGFKNYYALLNCGFRLRPTAGTASGVHPVPLGFGRVYVELDSKKPLDPDEWTKRLNEGRSFVTTGPMLFANVEGYAPGATIKFDPTGKGKAELSYIVRCESPLKTSKVEIIVNGQVIDVPGEVRGDEAPFVTYVRRGIPVMESFWIASRAWYTLPNGRKRFAHSSPTHVDVESKPVRPKKDEVEYLMKRVSDQIARSQDHLPKAAIDEYRQALAAYRKLLGSAK